jgi:hypothetical protein
VTLGPGSSHEDSIVTGRPFWEFDTIVYFINSIRLKAHLPREKIGKVAAFEVPTEERHTICDSVSKDRVIKLKKSDCLDEAR